MSTNHRQPQCATRRRGGRVLPVIALGALVLAANPACQNRGDVDRTETSADTPAQADPHKPDIQTMTSVSQYGITWTFDKAVPVGRFVTGDYYVIGPATITQVAPAAAGAGEAFRHGSMLNPPTGRAIAYDGRQKGFTQKLAATFPLSLRAGDTLISAVSLNQPQQNQVLVNPTKTKETSPLKTLAVLTCLPEAVPADAFRPGYCDLTKDRIHFARNVHWDKLPRYKSATAAMPEPWLSRYHPGAFNEDGSPKWAWLERAFQRPWVDHHYDWGSREMHASENMPGYGREVGRMVSYAGLALCLDVPVQNKRTLGLRLIQVGIDNWSVATRSKRGESGGWPAAGGFGNGRKMPIVFAAVLLNDPQMLHINDNAAEASFGEDEHTEFGPSWTGAKVRFTGQYPLIGHRQIDRGPYEHLPPAQWPGERATMSEGYRRCCTSICWVGQALAVRMVGALDVWDHDAFFAYVDRWMYQDESQTFPVIQAAHPNFASGIRQGGTHFDPWIDAMWQAHRTTFPTPTDGWE